MISIFQKNKVILNVDSEEERIRHIEEGWKELTSDEIKDAGMIGYEHLVSPVNTLVNDDGTITFTPSPMPTPEELEIQLQKQYTTFIQNYLDRKAYEFGYTGPNERIEGSCLSVCSYMDTGIQKFDDEGKAFRIWRSAIWNKGLEILSLVKSGEIEIPSEEELIEMLPKLEIVYTDN